MLSSVSRGLARLACGWAILCLGGCTSLPDCPCLNWFGRDLRTEARLYEFHDPFPDEKAGPHTEYRPRGFMDPRSDTRRDFDLRMLTSMASGSPGPLYTKGQRPGTLVSPIAPAVPIQWPQTVVAPYSPGLSSANVQPTLQLTPTDSAAR